MTFYLSKRKQFTPSQRLQIAYSQEWKCASCAQTLHWTFEIDHKQALFKGGNNSKHNLQALCAQCHRIKSYTERARTDAIDTDIQACAKKEELCGPITASVAFCQKCIYCKHCGRKYSPYFAHECAGNTTRLNQRKQPKIKRKNDAKQ